MTDEERATPAAASVGLVSVVAQNHATSISSTTQFNFMTVTPPRSNSAILEVRREMEVSHGTGSPTESNPALERDVRVVSQGISRTGENDKVRTTLRLLTDADVSKSEPPPVTAPVPRTGPRRLLISLPRKVPEEAVLKEELRTKTVIEQVPITRGRVGQLVTAKSSTEVVREEGVVHVDSTRRQSAQPTGVLPLTTSILVLLPCLFYLHSRRIM